MQQTPLLLLIALLLQGCSNSMGENAAQAKLLFTSSFENGVSITHHSSGQASFLHGSDGESDWDSLHHQFNYVKEMATLSDVESRITSEQARTGELSLYQSQKSVGDGVQNRLQIYGNDTGAFGSNIFIRRWLWYPDLEAKLIEDWQDLSIAGMREGDAYSMPLDIVRGPHNETLYWSLNGLNYAAGTVWSEWTDPKNGGWSVQNYVIPIPQQRWFKLDTYYERHAVHGVVKIWVDDQLLFDIQEVRTKGDGSAWFAKISDLDANLYENTSGLPIYHYVDDIEIWDTIPEW